jgi:hypothetical protein
MGEKFLVGIGVKILGPDDQRNIVTEVRIQQDAAKRTSFGIEAMRGQSIEDFRTDASGGSASIGSIGGRHDKINDEVGMMNDEPRGKGIPDNMTAS